MFAWLDPASRTGEVEQFWLWSAETTGERPPADERCGAQHAGRAPGEDRRG